MLRTGARGAATSRELPRYLWVSREMSPRSNVGSLMTNLPRVCVGVQLQSTSWWVGRVLAYTRHHPDRPVLRRSYSLKLDLILRGVLCIYRGWGAMARGVPWVPYSFSGFS